MSRRAVFSCLSVFAAALALAACGSSSNTSSSALSAGTGGPGASASNYQARLNYAKCMRSHGVNVPDPSANGGPAAGAGTGGGGFQSLRNNPNFQSASQACAKYRSKAFGFANITPAERAQFQQEQVKFAECMRSHSVNIPDPSSSGTGGGGFGAIFRDITPAERQSPAFQTAFKDCSATLPFRRRGGGGGAPGGPPA
jgi:hypothetical protein